MGIFLALTTLAIAISGAIAFAFFWPMSLVHLRDRHPQLLRGFGNMPFIAPKAMKWLLLRRHTTLHDSSLNGLATPASLALWCMLIALAASGVLWLIYR